MFIKWIKLLLLSLALSINFLVAQVRLEGTLLSIQSSELVEYANIGVLNKNVGTITDKQGKFQLLLHQVDDSDTLKISRLGFESIVISIQDFKKELISNNYKILMQEVSYELSEVVINPSDFKKKSFIGYEHKHKRVHIGFENYASGNELGRLIGNKHLVLVNQLVINCSDNTFTKIKLRVNFYNIKNDMPHQKINTKDIYLDITNQKRGKLKFDLSEHKLKLENDFFLTLEAVETEGKGVFTILGEWYGGGIYSRKSSQMNWEKTPPHSVAVGLEVKQNND
jgi:hypothetical protein